MCHAANENWGKRRKKTKGIKQENQERIRTLGEKENYKYMGILEADTIEQTKVKERVRNTYFKRIRTLFKTVFYNRNLKFSSKE